MMKSTAVEIRQPYSMPQTFNVPDYPKLAELAARLEKLNEEVLSAAGEIASLSQEQNTLGYESQLVTATSDTFARLAEVQQQLARFEYRHAQAQAQAKRVSEELGSLRHDFAWRFYRRQLLSAELAQALRSNEIRAYQPGEKTRRPRIEVLTELSDCVGWLAVWTCDPKLADELETIQAQLTEAWQQQ